MEPQVASRKRSSKRQAVKNKSKKKKRDKLKDKEMLRLQMELDKEKASKSSLQESLRPPKQCRTTSTFKMPSRFAMKRTQNKYLATSKILSQKLNVPTFSDDDLERGSQIGYGVFGTM